MNKHTVAKGNVNVPSPVSLGSIPRPPFNVNYQHTLTSPVVYYPYLVMVTNVTGTFITFNGIHLDDDSKFTKSYTVDLHEVNDVWRLAPSTDFSRLTTGSHTEATDTNCGLLLLSPAYVTFVDPPPPGEKDPPNLKLCTSNSLEKWPKSASIGPTLKIKLEEFLALLNLLPNKTLYQKFHAMFAEDLGA